MLKLGGGYAGSHCEDHRKQPADHKWYKSAYSRADPAQDRQAASVQISGDGDLKATNLGEPAQHEIIESFSDGNNERMGLRASEANGIGAESAEGKDARSHLPAQHEQVQLTSCSYAPLPSCSMEYHVLGQR